MRILVDQLKAGRRCSALTTFGLSRAGTGPHEQALAHFHKAGAAFSDGRRLRWPNTHSGMSANRKHALGELDSRSTRRISYQIAQAHAWRGERDAAFEWFERAYAQRDAGVTTHARRSDARAAQGRPRATRHSCAN
jgi:hypothetical protein